MKTKIILFAAFLISLCSYAQNDEVLFTTMLEQANSMGKKFMDQDYAGFLKYSHPRTIEVLGGEQTAIMKFTQQMKEIGDEGITFISINYGTPSKIIRAGNELQSTLPQIIEMHVPGGIVTATTTLLTISQNNGKNWSFLDTANYNHYDMKQLLPNLSDEIIIPERTDPAFEPDPKPSTKTE